MDRLIHYKETHTYKYILTKRYIVDLPSAFHHITIVNHSHLEIFDGALYISSRYRWDGPSGPAIDTKNFMRGSLVHDALYQLMREGHINRELRKAADKLLRLHCREDGMSWIRSQNVYWGLRLGGKSSVQPSDNHHEQIAP